MHRRPDRIPPGSLLSRGRAASRSIFLLAALAVPGIALGQEVPPAHVRTESVRMENVQERRLVTGSIRSARRSRVATREEGLVLELVVKEGDEVEEGVVLCRIDATRLEIQIRTMQAEKKLAGAVLAERNADAGRKKADLDALRDLSDRDATNPRELADAESAWQIAQARVEQGKEQIGIIEERLALLEQRRADTEIRAPFAGLVTARHTERGQWLGRGDAIVELVSLDDLEAWLDVPQAHLAAIEHHRGPIRLRFGGSEDEVEVARFRLVRDVALRTRGFPLVAEVPKTAGVAPGMSVTAWVPTGQEGEHITVSRDAILRSDTGSFVYTVIDAPGGGGKAASPMPVEILFGVGDRAVLRRGALRPGMQVVREGNERLFPMAAIVPLEEEANEADETDEKGGSR
ncbi:MAG: efflux RND transporter periplasmic adaptor subunit [Planctomycetota bacterium]|nr:efflux RND transporter periplasmic adaptor subunit [Planctomycetota bacterium]